MLHGIQEIKDFIRRYEKYLSPVLLVTGFIIDSLTLTRADVGLDNLILLSYLLLAGLSILILNINEGKELQSSLFKRIILWLPLVLQFAFGGLFSGFVVLYSRSASLAASWPFLIILLLLLVGNEYFRNRYRRLVFQISIYFVAVFSYLTFAIPVIIDTIGPLVFILSGVLSLAVMALVFQILRRTASHVFENYRRTVWPLVLLLYIGFNILYFANIIPPIPLALKDLVIAHRVEHDETGNFKVTYETKRWYNLFKNFNPTYHRFGNEPVYAFSAIYAPSNLRTTIIHEWEFFDFSVKEWVTASQLQYPISGGRERGFRGFSFKTHMSPGAWRISVKTKNGQVLGRAKFTLLQASSPAETVTEIK